MCGLLLKFLFTPALALITAVRLTLTIQAPVLKRLHRGGELTLPASSECKHFNCEDNMNPIRNAVKEITKRDLDVEDFHCGGSAWLGHTATRPLVIVDSFKD